MVIIFLSSSIETILSISQQDCKIRRKLFNKIQILFVVDVTIPDFVSNSDL